MNFFCYSSFLIKMYDIKSSIFFSAEVRSMLLSLLTSLPYYKEIQI